MARRAKSPVPMRKCIGCMESKEKDKLIRIALSEGKLVYDESGTMDGRGCYLCKASEDCLKKAIKKKAFSRVYKMNLDASVLEENREVR